MKLIPLLLLLAACPSKAPPPKGAPLDKDGIQQRSDATHEDLKKEEKKSEERKDQQNN